MASADAAVTCEAAVSEELVAALRERIATLTFEARDLEAVNLALHVEVAALKKQLRVTEADREHYWESLDLARAFAEEDKKVIGESAKKVAELTEEVAELTAENGGLWHEVVGRAVQGCKRRRLG